MMTHDIFISYSSKQKSIADGVCHYLEENGFKCWMAPRDITVGSEYGDLIEEAIKTSKVVVLVFSQSASISKWVKGEVNVAFAEDKPILPFRVDDTEIKGGFRVMLNQMHWIDAFPKYADRLPDLLNSVCGFLGRQPQKVSDDNAKLEAESKAKEAAERERLERKRKAEEARRKAEQERLERELAEAQRRAEQERVNQLKVLDNSKLKSKKILWIALGVVAVVALVLALVWPNSLSVSGNFNGHDYVDLGLPSGTLWATCNVGAGTPEDYGDYFAWGEPQPKTTYEWSTYEYSNGDHQLTNYQLTKYCSQSIYGYNGFADNLTVLQPSDDAATVNWGGGWCMPTEWQWDELLSNTKSIWTKKKGVKGRLFISKKNSQTLFLPAAGCRWYDNLGGVGSDGNYWSSKLNTDNPGCAKFCYFTSYYCRWGSYYRLEGASVRPVRFAHQN